MNILHYILGTPPYRSGGLTKYAIDLMMEQRESNNNVSALYPGDFVPLNHSKTYITTKKWNGFTLYEIKNPSPIPLLYGVKNPLSIFNPQRTLSEKEMDFLYKKVHPEIFHIHTLMGLPIELLSYLKNKNVKLIYTTHDYYGLCPKVNFINHNGNLCETADGKHCSICNAESPSNNFLMFRNSSYIMRYKRFLSKIAQSDSNLRDENSEVEKSQPTTKTIQQYNNLLIFYKKLFDNIDLFHFNSSLVENVYKTHYTIKKSITISVTHKQIADKRTIKSFNQSKIRFGFIGNRTAYKGFPLLKETLIKLSNNGINNWELNVWGNGKTTEDHDCEQIQYRGTYNYTNLKEIFEMDLLIVPSIWKETFSLTTLEAISYGVPVLVTSNVGARDLVLKYNDEFVIQPNKESLYEILNKILHNANLLKEYNKQIIEKPFHYTMKEHEATLRREYKKLINDENSDIRN
jgi:glycosyltransferase involved in cell wall biosynthesis